MAIIASVAASVIGAAASSAMSSGGGTSQAAGMADPFASQRSQYATMLQQMMTGKSPGHWQDVPGQAPTVQQPGALGGGLGIPGSTPMDGTTPQQATPQQQWVDGTSTGGFTPNDPSYQWRFNQGLEAVNRTDAAKHMLGSGNRLMDLMNYGQGMASTEYANQFSRLAQLSGANIGSPGQAAQLQDAYSQRQATGGGMIGQTIGQGISNYFNSNTGGGMSTAPNTQYFDPNQYSSNYASPILDAAAGGQYSGSAGGIFQGSL